MVIDAFQKVFDAEPSGLFGGTLFRGDVLLELDGQKLADDGTFAVGQQERRCLQRPHPHLHPSPQPNPQPSPSRRRGQNLSKT